MTRKFVGSSKGDVVSQILEALEIKQATLYKRMEFLGVSIQKEDGESWINEADYEELCALSAYIEINGRTEGFERRIDKAVTVQESRVKSQELSVSESSYNQGHQRNASEQQQQNQINQLVQSAQRKATGVLIAEGVLAQQFIANPEQLPEELRSQIEEANAIPQIDPNGFAAMLLDATRNKAA